MTYTIWAIIGYLIGSIPFGLILTKIAKTEDIRKIGSGNIGATNVLRTGRKDLAALTVLFDVSKAAIVAILAYRLTTSEGITLFSHFTTTNILTSLIAGSSAIIGHNFPIWLKFKGGKGVAPAFGFIVVTSPIVGLLALITWLFMAFTFKYSSLSAITAAIAVPVFSYFFAAPIYNYFYLPIIVIVLILHSKNIKRLLKKEESKISFKKK